MRRQTSAPSIPGSIRSSTIRSGESRCGGVERLEAVGGGIHEEAGRPQVGGRHLEHGGVVFDHQHAPIGQLPVLAATTVDGGTHTSE